MNSSSLNPATDNVGTGTDSKNQVIEHVKVLSVSRQCNDSWYGMMPPTYHEIGGDIEDALKNIIGTGILEKIKENVSDIRKPFEYCDGYEGSSSFRLHLAVKIDGVLYVNV